MSLSYVHSWYTFIPGNWTSKLETGGKKIRQIPHLLTRFDKSSFLTEIGIYYKYHPKLLLTPHPFRTTGFEQLVVDP